MTDAARDTADRIGIEVERDAALAEVVKLRNIIADVIAYVVENSAEGDDGESAWVNSDDLLAFIAKAVPHDR